MPPSPRLSPEKRQQILDDLEAGKIEPHSDLIEHVAVALGRRLRDFAEE